MILVSISIQCHDASMCIMNNDEVLFFIQEERISKIKHSSALPLKMLDCISYYTNSIDYLCISNFIEEEKNHILNFLSTKNIKVGEVILDNEKHHLFHSASGFYRSGFEEATCLVIDGWGDTYFYKDNFPMKETTSIYTAKYSCEFNPIYKNFYINLNEEYGRLNLEEIEKIFDYEVTLNTHLDIGLMYAAITRHVGFSVHNQGKTMGLASYGKKNNQIPNLLVEDSIFSNMNVFERNKTLNTKLFPYLKNMSFRQKADLCYELQKCLEKIFLKRVEYAIEKTNCKNLIFSGGCALNILGNSAIKKKFKEINFYVDPVPNDAGQSFGAAQFYYHKITNDNKIKKNNQIYLGIQYENNFCLNTIKKSVKKYNFITNYF